MLEFHRVIVTRYRTGSHNLKIELGRLPPKIDVEERICKCAISIQTLKHCLLECPLLAEARERYQIVDIINGVYNIDYLMEMERLLELKC